MLSVADQAMLQLSLDVWSKAEDDTGLGRYAAFVATSLMSGSSPRRLPCFRVVDVSPLGFIPNLMQRNEII